MRSMKKTLPAVALRGLTIMPGMIVHFDIDRDKSVHAVERAMVKDQTLFLVKQRQAEVAEPVWDDLHPVGTIAQIKQVLKLPNHIVRVLVEAQTRAELLSIEEDDTCLVTLVRTYGKPKTELDETEKMAMISTLKDLMAQYLKFNPRIGKTIERQFDETREIGTLADFISINLPMDTETRQTLLEAIDERDRFNELITVLMNDLEIMNIRKGIQDQVKERVEKNQKQRRRE